MTAEVQPSLRASSATRGSTCRRRRLPDARVDARHDVWLLWDVSLR